MNLKSKVLSFFKKKAHIKQGDIIFHPNVKINKPIVYCFDCEAKQYYRFSNDYEIPKGRFAFIQKFYNEVTLKITSDDLKEFCKAIKEYSNQGKLGEVWKLADELEYRDTWLFEPESLLRFASGIYFTLNEDVTDYDFEFNSKKITAFSKKKMLEYFVMKLMNGEKLLSGLSENDLPIYFQQLQEKVEKQRRLMQDSMVTNGR